MKSPLFLSIVLATLISGAIFVLNINVTLAAGVNLIQNPGFEEAGATDPSIPANWQTNSWGSVQANFIYPAPGISNTSAVSVFVVSTHGNGDAKWFFDDVSVDADQTYVFGTHYRADVSTEINARYLLSDGTYLYTYLATLPASSDWSHETVVFNVPSNAISVTIFHLLYSVGSLTVDDVSLELQGALPPPPPPPNSQSLILNYNVEEGTNAPLGWSHGGWGSNIAKYVYPVSGFNGGKAIRVELSSWLTGDVKWLHPAVSVKSGDKYFFNNYYRSNVASNITLQYKLNNGTYSYVWLANLPPANEWSASNIHSFIVPPNAMEVTVFHLINSVGFLETDNYILTGDVVSPPPPPPPPPDPNNMITNGNLDTANTGNPAYPAGWNNNSWGTLNADFSYPVAGAFGGAAAARVVINSISSGDAKWLHAPVSILPNTTYTFFDDYRSNVNTAITLQYKLTNGSYSYVWLGAAPASANWTSVNYTFTTPLNAVEVTVFHLIAVVGWLETDNYKMIKSDSLSFSEAMVTLVFDDGTKSIYENALPILDSAGIKSTQAIVSGYVTYDNYMNVGQIMDMQNNGHEIASHSRTHAHLTQLDTAGLQSEIVGSRDDLLAMGFALVSTFVYPYGEFNSTVTQFIADSGYYIGARTVEQGFNYTNTNPYLLTTQHVGNNTNLQQLKDAIDLAIANKSWVTFMFHDVMYGGGEYSTTPDVLQGLVDYIKSTGINTVTLNQGSQILNN